MALIRFPEGQQRSGSAGGTVFSHNRYGAYIRARSIPVNPSTDRQVLVRNAVRALAIAWNQDLTPVQRTMWELYGENVAWTNRFGDTVYLTGMAHYIRSNTVRIQCGLARVDNGSGIFNLAPAELGLSASGSEATGLVSLVSDVVGHAWAAEDGGFQAYYMGRPQNAGINFFGGPYRLIGCQEGKATPNGDPTSPWPQPAPWPMQEGQRVWIRSRIGRADGRLSDLAQCTFHCAA